MSFIKAINIFIFCLCMVSNLSAMQDKNIKIKEQKEEIEALFQELISQSSVNDIANIFGNIYLRKFKDKKTLKDRALFFLVYLTNFGYKRSEQENISSWMSAQNPNPIYKGIVAKERHNGNIRIYCSNDSYIELEFKNKLNSLLFSLDGRYLIASSNGAIVVWEINIIKTEEGLKIDAKRLKNFSYNNENNPLFLVGCTEDGFVQCVYKSSYILWNYTDNNVLPQELMSITRENITAAACTNDIFFIGTEEGTILGFRKNDYKCLFRSKIVGSCSQINLSYNGRFVSAINDSELATHWDLLTIRALELIEKNASNVFNF